MEQRTAKYWLQKLVLSAVLVGEGMLLADAVAVFLGKTIHELVFAALCGGLTLVLFFLPRLTVRRTKFMGGSPMKPATNMLLGLKYTSFGVPICCT